MIRYGKNNCEHEWVYRNDGYEEYCIPVICKKCGAFGCGCNLNDSVTINDDFFTNGLNSFDNVNNSWVNPYIKQNK